MPSHHNNSMNANNNATRGNLCTIKVRNVQSSLMYHLMFEGDIGALTGAQLRQHVEGVSGVPADRQILSIQGRSIGSMTTGHDVDLKNGSTVMLEVVGNAPNSSYQQQQQQQLQQQAQSPSSPPRPAANHSAPRPYYDQQYQQQPSSNQYYPPLQQQQQQIRNVSPDSSAIYGRPAMPASRVPLGTNSSRHPADDMPPLPPQPYATVGRNSSYQRTAAVPRRGGYGDPDDVDVIVDIVEESDAPAAVPEVGPGFVGGDQVAISQFRRTAADVEEMRLQQQEYTWKLEQVRFETERLNREREMKRQLMELEYEATLLDRDRIDLERHTAMEKQKLSQVGAQNRLELDILQKFYPSHLQ